MIVVVFVSVAMTTISISMAVTSMTIIGWLDMDVSMEVANMATISI